MIHESDIFCKIADDEVDEVRRRKNHRNLSNDSSQGQHQQIDNIQSNVKAVLSEID